MRHAAPEISLISFELSMLPQLVRMIVQPETLLCLPHLSTPKRALGGRPVGNAREFIPENSICAPLTLTNSFVGRITSPPAIYRAA